MNGLLAQSERWFEELVDAAAARVRGEISRGLGGWEAPWRLLHGLASIGSPGLQHAAQAALRDLASEVARAARDDPGRPAQPVWLPLLPQIAATGEVWEMHDVYGGRFAVIAAFSYPGGTDPSVFLYDIDACGAVELVHAGVFDDVAQAARAWREFAGDAAGAAQPTPVDTPERLHCLAHWDSGEDSLHGAESQSRIDNWYRARRRGHDVSDALGERGMPLPDSELTHGGDMAALGEAFTSWYVRRHGGAEPDAGGVEALTEELFDWLLPGTEHVVSPHRVAGLRHTVFHTWVDDAATAAAQELFPEWVRWNGERSGLPGHLLDRAVAVAAGAPRTERDCPGAGLETTAI